MAAVGNFPQDRADKCKHNKAPGVKRRNENKRCCSHDGAPGKNAARHTALVLHKKLLKGTVENNTDYVTQIIKYCDQ